MLEWEPFSIFVEPNFFNHFMVFFGDSGFDLVEVGYWDFFASVGGRQFDLVDLILLEMLKVNPEDLVTGPLYAYVPVVTEHFGYGIANYPLLGVLSDFNLKHIGGHEVLMFDLSSSLLNSLVTVIWLCGLGSLECSTKPKIGSFSTSPRTRGS
jgi:hypothetical protein